MKKITNSDQFYKKVVFQKKIFIISIIIEVVLQIVRQRVGGLIVIID